MYQIDKNVPIPTISQDARRKYPFAIMEVGDSFFVAATSAKDARRLRATIKTLLRRGRFDQDAFLIAPEGSGLRIWRIK